MAKRQTFQGILYDIIEEMTIDSAPVVRGTYAEAMADAKALVSVVNQMAECADDESEDDSSIGRFDESYCFVMVDGYVVYSEAEV